MTVSALPDGSVRFAEPYFVTPHAIQRYQERVDRRLGWQEVVVAVNTALQGAGPSDGSGYPPDRTIALGVEGRFVAIVEPPPPDREWPSVVTIWRWGVCPILLKRKGGPHVGHRFYRWLNRPYHGRGGDAGGSRA